jgi:hypothetical protein
VAQRHTACLLNLSEGLTQSDVAQRIFLQRTIRLLSNATDLKPLIGIQIEHLQSKPEIM